MLSNNHNLCVDNPQIKEVYVIEDDEIYTAQQAIGNNYDEAVKLRMELSESISLKKPKYICPICLVGVYIACSRHNNDKKFYFKHIIENGNCPAETRSTLTKPQIEAMKYNGVKESQAHIRMKEIIYESLSQDPNFSDIKLEAVIKGEDRKSWRKPDIQALWQGKLRVAFEVQLSTTFLKVIGERRLFYKAQNSLVCWVFKKYDKENALMKQDDIFVNNNQNLFLASEDTLKSSKQNKALMLNCHWYEPKINHNNIVKEWNSKYVKFKELEYDLDKQAIYYFDYKNEQEKLINKLENGDLKERFEEWWIKHNHPPEYKGEWKAFVDEFTNKGIYINEYPYDIHNLISGLYSAKYGKVIGSDYDKLVQVAHTIANLKDKSVLQIFRVALLIYNRGNQLVEEDKSGKWKTKSNEFRKLLYTTNDYQRNKNLDNLMKFLFPELMKKEVWAKLKAFDDKHNLKNP